MLSPLTSGDSVSTDTAGLIMVIFGGLLYLVSGPLGDAASVLLSRTIADRLGIGPGRSGRYLVPRVTASVIMFAGFVMLLTALFQS